MLVLTCLGGLFSSPILLLQLVNSSFSVFLTEQTNPNLCFHFAFYLKHGSFVPMFPVYSSFFLPHILIFFFILCDFYFFFQLTFWNGSFDDSEICRKAFLGDGAVGVDCQCQNARVGDDPARRVLTTVSSNVRTNWTDRNKREQRTNIVSWVRLGLTQYLFVCHNNITQCFFFFFLLPTPL